MDTGVWGDGIGNERDLLRDERDDAIRTASIRDRSITAMSFAAQKSRIAHLDIWPERFRVGQVEISSP